MPLYHFFIDDDRYETPVELEVRVGAVARARELAERTLTQSPHHLGVEVCENGGRLFGLGSFAHRSWCSAKAKGHERLERMREAPAWLQGALGALFRLTRSGGGRGREPATPA